MQAAYAARGPSFWMTGASFLRQATANDYRRGAENAEKPRATAARFDETEPAATNSKTTSKAGGLKTAATKAITKSRRDDRRASD